MRSDVVITRVRVRTALVGAVALAAALAGCGSSSGEKAAAAPSATSAPTSSAATSSPSKAPTSPASATSATATPAPTHGGTGDWAAFPGFTPFPGMADTFAPTPSTGDPVKDKILADNIEVMRALDVWSTTGRFDSPGVSTYLGPSIYAEFKVQAAEYSAAGKAPAGIARFYDRMVPAHDSKSGRIVLCEDGRQGYDVYVKSGRMVPDSSDGVVAITITVLKDSSGIWRAVLFNKAKNPALCPTP